MLEIISIRIFKDELYSPENAIRLENPLKTLQILTQKQLLNFVAYKDLIIVQGGLNRADG